MLLLLLEDEHMKPANGQGKKAFLFLFIFFLLEICILTSHGYRRRDIPDFLLQRRVIHALI
jgi:hypothetical protein